MVLTSVKSFVVSLTEIILDWSRFNKSNTLDGSLKDGTTTKATQIFWKFNLYQIVVSV